MSRPTQAARSTGRWPNRTDSGRGAEMDWERIMVQITFAFVIILGYLVSVGVDEVTDLAAEMESQKQRNELLRTVVGELKDTDVGKAIAGRVAAEKDLQLEKLLQIWTRQYVERRLYELLRYFDLNAERIPLSDDRHCLPIGKEFKGLNEEIEDVFPASNESVGRKAVEDEIQKVLKLAELALPSLPPLSSEVASLHFEKKEVTPENLQRLRQQIVWDLQHERTRISDLQYKLVGRIAAARRDWLAKQPLPKDVDVQTNDTDTDLGLRMLEEVLADLEGQMNLLPETVDRLRKGSSTDQAKDTSQERNLGRSKGAR